MGPPAGDADDEPIAAQATHLRGRKDRRTVIDEHFDGDVALYEEYLISCRDQFGLDVAAGDSACRSADHAALQRLAHSLKGVFALLGDDAGAVRARAVEKLAAQRLDAGEAWRGVRVHLLAHLPNP